LTANLTNPLQIGRKREAIERRRCCEEEQRERNKTSSFSEGGGKKQRRSVTTCSCSPCSRLKGGGKERGLGGESASLSLLDQTRNFGRREIKEHRSKKPSPRDTGGCRASSAFPRKGLKENEERPSVRGVWGNPTGGNGAWRDKIEPVSGAKKKHVCTPCRKKSRISSTRGNSLLVVEQTIV